MADTDLKKELTVKRLRQLSALQGSMCSSQSETKVETNLWGGASDEVHGVISSVAVVYDTKVGCCRIRNVCYMLSRSGHITQLSTRPTYHR